MINKMYGGYTLRIAIGISALVLLVSSAGATPFAYVTNSGNNNVSVIDTATNTVTDTVNVGNFPFGVAVNPTGTKVYVANAHSNNVSVIDTATNTVTATANVGDFPIGVAVNPTGTEVYVANSHNSSVSVIDTATNTVTATVNVGDFPERVAVNPAGTKVYVTRSSASGGGTVSVIDTATNTVTATVNVGGFPVGVAVNPAGTKVYVTNRNNQSVSVIDTATNTVTATVNVGGFPVGVVVNPTGTKVYVTNGNSHSVSVIDAATNTVTATVNVGSTPDGIAVNPAGTKVYVANAGSNNVSVIDAATNTVTASINVGSIPNGVAVSPPTSVATFNISGFKVNDTDGDNIWQPGEMGIENWNINLLNATTGTQIASTLTNMQGFYEFMNLTPGVYNVTEELKAGFTPSGATFKVITIENMDVTDVDFLNHVTVIPTPTPTLTPTPTPTPTPIPAPVTGSISGFKINTANGMGLPSWNIRLIGIVPETAGINKETTTDDRGFYSFENLPAGMYLVVETLKGGYVPSDSPVLVVNLENGTNSMNNNFTNNPISSLIPSLP